MHSVTADHGPPRTNFWRTISIAIHVGRAALGGAGGAAALFGLLNIFAAVLATRSHFGFHSLDIVAILGAAVGAVVGFVAETRQSR